MLVSVLTPANLPRCPTGYMSHHASLLHASMCTVWHLLAFSAPCSAQEASYGHQSHSVFSQLSAESAATVVLTWLLQHRQVLYDAIWLQLRSSSSLTMTVSSLACSDALVWTCSLWLYAKLCSGQGLSRVIVSKPWSASRLVLDLPLQFYNHINSELGQCFIALVYAWVSSTMLD